jgi:transposase
VLPVLTASIISVTLRICDASIAGCCPSYTNHREPNDGDVFIVMSRDRHIVRLFTYDNRSYSLFEKKFVSGYKFMKVEREGGELVYRIDWKDVVLLLENPIVKTLKIK